MSNHLKSNYNQMIVLDVSPESANWQWLTFRIIKIKNQQVYLHQTELTELALVPLEGAGTVQTKAGDFPLSRAGVFQEKPSVLYVPPGQEFGVASESRFEFAIGAAPAEGKYPLRLFGPDEIKSELRGGGAARRQVHHTLAYPLPVTIDSAAPLFALTPHCVPPPHRPVHSNPMPCPHLMDLIQRQLEILNNHRHSAFTGLA